MKMLFDLLHWLRKWYWRTFNVETFGVRIIIIKNNKYLLVRHRYGDYWVFPGGGIKKGEEIEKAGAREVFDEVGINIKAFEKVLGTYKNTTGGKNDTVTVLVVKEWEESTNKKWNLEIKEKRFFDLDNFPKEISPATLNRIKEYTSREDRYFTGSW